ncbi:MAG: hypothetical protein IPK35_01410 [Saprospiraceae bacterium]|nr:hypothetical protein [Saprospiraceae bacterium]
MKKYLIPKLIGLAILTMIILVSISILEVAVYSHLINPGQEITVYETHASQSAPYVSGIFGFIIFFLVARFWNQKKYDNIASLVFLFPLTYVLIDIIVLVLADVKWADFLVIFLIANSAKFLGCFLGYKLTK